MVLGESLKLLGGVFFNLMPKSIMTKSSFGLPRSSLRAAALAAVCGALLVGCGGGSSEDTPMGRSDTTPPMSVTLPADLPSDYAPAAGSMAMIPAGESRTLNGVMFSCASGGESCEVMVAANGDVSSTGGMVTATLTKAVSDILASGSNRATREAQRSAANMAIAAATTAVGDVNNDSSDADVTSAETAVTAAQKAVMDATALTPGEREQLMNQVTMAKGNLDTAIKNRMDADNAAMKKAGREMYAALAGNATPNTTALDNITTAGTVLTRTTLTINAESGAGALPDATDPNIVTLEVGDAAESLGDWQGMHYGLTTGTGAAKVTNEALVYTNPGEPTSAAFGEEYGAGNPSAGDGAYTVATRTLLITVAQEGVPAKVSGSMFEQQGGTTTHAVAGAPPVSFRGTYDGAPGLYSCTTTGAPCTSAFNNDTGMVTALAGAWSFTHDVGAMVSQPDDNYLFFGWWLSRDNDDMPTAASAFVGEVGTVSDGWSGDFASSAASLPGSAKYAGKAAGKFAINNPLDGMNGGGHFTADAMLEAKFGTGTTDGITGMINNFRLNDESMMDPGWSVSLGRGTFGDDGAITAPAATVDATVWSINDDAAEASGTWSGHMYDEDADDGSNIPTTVIGTFYSEFSGFGRMVGAFGADHQE